MLAISSAGQPLIVSTQHHGLHRIVVVLELQCLLVFVCLIVVGVDFDVVAMGEEEGAGVRGPGSGGHAAGEVVKLLVELGVVVPDPDCGLFGVAGARGEDS